MLTNREPLLTWLQQLYLSNINSAIFPMGAEDKKIRGQTFYEDIASRAGVLKVYTLSNPGWNLEFDYRNTLYVHNSWIDIWINSGINLIDQDSEEWFIAEYKENEFTDSGGPLYLSSSLETFRCFIEQKELVINDLSEFREKLKKDNPLLCWLEEFYHSCCDTDWEHMYGYSLISVKEGWLMVLSVEELHYEDQPFERRVIKEEGGEVECYMLQSQFIIRAHWCGLITGIRVFKEWIESQPEYEEKRKEVY